MALLFFDGFDTADGAFANYGGKYTTVVGCTGSTSPVRTGARSVQMTSGGSSFLGKTLVPAPSGGFVVGVALYLLNNPSAAADLFQIREGTTVHLALTIDSARHVVVKRGTTTLATGTSSVPGNSWIYIEFKGVIDDVAGSYEVRLDGLMELSATGVDTRNAGTGVWTNVALQPPATGSPMLHLDDLYICDQSGPRNNDFLGPVKVETLLPQTDAVAAGSNAGFTPSAGTDHGALVDETVVNTTDFNSGATVGVKDTYQYPALTLPGTILGIQTNLFVSKSDNNARQVCPVVRTGGVDYDGANVSPLTSYTYFTAVREVNPATGVLWVAAEVDAIEAGMKVTV